MSDNIQFDTLITGTVNPSITIVPIGRGLELARAGLTATGRRDDKHSVIIVLTLPPETARPRALTIAERRALGAAQREVAAEQIERQREIRANGYLRDIARGLTNLR